MKFNSFFWNNYRESKSGSKIIRMFEELYLIYQDSSRHPELISFLNDIRIDHTSEVKDHCEDVLWIHELISTADEKKNTKLGRR